MTVEQIIEELNYRINHARHLECHYFEKWQLDTKDTESQVQGQMWFATRIAYEDLRQKIELNHRSNTNND